MMVSDTRTGNLDEHEVAQFEALADDWWDPNGKFKPLHKIGPVRVGFIRDVAVAHFGLDDGAAKPLAGLKIIDIGCGGGLVCEPLARLGGDVTGLDPAGGGLETARAHAAASGLEITYRHERIEEVAGKGETFDIAVCLEVVEHVPDVEAFVASCASAVKPGGLLILSTINRNLKSYLLAIVGAEYVLRWLPRGTHDWNRFIKPRELRGFVEAAGMDPFQKRGMIYNPLGDTWRLSSDTDVNYVLAARKADADPSPTT